jgi:hypothetical protein
MGPSLAASNENTEGDHRAEATSAQLIYIEADSKIDRKNVNTSRIIV